MARIAGVTLPSNKRLDIALTYIYGIGSVSAKSIIKETGIDGSIRVKDLTEEQANKVRETVESTH